MSNAETNQNQTTPAETCFCGSDNTRYTGSTPSGEYQNWACDSCGESFKVLPDIGEEPETPRVWIGSLSAYNAGNLVGEWVDATDLEAMEAVAAKLPGEEIALMDREGFGNLIDEYTALETVAAIAEALVEHGDAFRFYCENEPCRIENDIQALVGEFEKAYCGTWGSLRDYAENLAEELGAIPEDSAWPLNCIDWEQAARELPMDYWERGGHVFRSV